MLCLSIFPLDEFITKSPILFNFTTLLTKSGKRALAERRTGGHFLTVKKNLCFVEMMWCCDDLLCWLTLCQLRHYVVLCYVFQYQIVPSYVKISLFYVHFVLS